MKNQFSKQIAFFIGAICFLISCTPKKSEDKTIKLNISGLSEGETEILTFYDYRLNPLDSVSVTQNGEVSFERSWEEPQLVYLGNRELRFLSDKGLVSIDVSFDENAEIDKDQSKVTNASFTENVKLFSAFSEDYEQLMNKEKELDVKWQALRKKFSPNVIPKEARASLDSAYIQFFEGKKNFFKDYVAKNNNIASQYIFLTDLRFSYRAKDLDSLFSVTPDKQKNTPYYKILKEKAEILRNVEIGAVAPDIVSTDTAGNELKLSSLRGKYVLLDFWASWCVPCRKENPWVKKAYNRFHKKGFDVFAVSFDFPGQKDKWIEAIQKDELTWSHVSSLKGWKDPLSKIYNISGIPSPFLLDPEGKIIAKSDKLREEGLIQTLEGIFEEKEM